MPALSTIQGNPTKEPTAKTKAVAVGGGVAAALTTIASYFIFKSVLPEPIDADLEAAVVVLVGSAITTAAGFAASWLTPHGAAEGIAQPGLAPGLRDGLTPHAPGEGVSHPPS